MLLDFAKSQTHCVANLKASHERHDKNTENIAPPKEKKNLNKILETTTINELLQHRIYS